MWRRLSRSGSRPLRRGTAAIADQPDVAALQPRHGAGRLERRPRRRRLAALPQALREGHRLHAAPLPASRLLAATAPRSASLCKVVGGRLRYLGESLRGGSFSVRTHESWGAAQCGRVGTLEERGPRTWVARFVSGKKKTRNEVGRYAKIKIEGGGIRSM